MSDPDVQGPAVSAGFEHPFVVRFSQVDGAGIVFFSRIFELCHEAFEALLDQGGLPLAQILGGGSWGLPLVHSEARFCRPLRLGDRGSITVEVAERQESRVTFAYTVHGSDDDVRATARFTHACVNRADFRPRSLPAALGEALHRAGVAAW